MINHDILINLFETYTTESEKFDSGNKSAGSVKKDVKRFKNLRTHKAESYGRKD